MKAKKYTNKDLRTKFLFNLQFYLDEYGTLCCELVKNNTYGEFEQPFSMAALGTQMAKSTLLTKIEKKGLLSFFRAYREVIIGKSEVQEMYKIANNKLVEFKKEIDFHYKLLRPKSK